MTVTELEPTPQRETIQLLIDFLQQARDAEHALAGFLVTAKPLASEDEYADLLAEEAEHSRQRLNDLDARLAAHGQEPSPLSAAATAVRYLADDTLHLSLAAVTGGLSLLRRERIEPNLVDAARTQCAATAFARATYRAVRETAQVTGDHTTSDMAAECHSALGDLLERLDTMLPSLVMRACETVGRRPSYPDAATTVTARVRGAAEHLGQDADEVQQQLRDGFASWGRRARRVPGVMAGEDRVRKATGAIAQEEELPIRDYSSLTASRIIDQLPQLSQEQLAQIEGYERTHANRATVLRKIRAHREEKPSPATTP
jgi:hypothetical protein